MQQTKFCALPRTVTAFGNSVVLPVVVLRDHNIDENGGNDGSEEVSAVRLRSL